MLQYPNRYDDDFINTFKRAIDYINAQGKAIQDLVAEGQLTDEQYSDLLISINGLVRKGEVSVEDLNFYLRTQVEKLGGKASVESVDALSKEIENIIVSAGDGTKDTEIVNARTDAKGSTSPTLKNRLDEKDIEYYLFASMMDNSYQSITLNDVGEVGMIEHISHEGDVLRRDVYKYEEGKITEERTLWTNDAVTIIHDITTQQSMVLDRKTPEDLIPYDLETFSPFTNTVVENGYMVYDGRVDTVYNKEFDNGKLYGIIGFASENSLTKDYILHSAFTGSYDTILPAGQTGAFKAIFTSKSTGDIPSIILRTYADETGILKVKDLRLFELPTNSQLTHEFKTMTADELHSKYPKEGI